LIIKEILNQVQNDYLVGLPKLLVILKRLKIKQFLIALILSYSESVRKNYAVGIAMQTYFASGCITGIVCILSV